MKTEIDRYVYVSCSEAELLVSHLQTTAPLQPIQKPVYLHPNKATLLTQIGTDRWVEWWQTLEEKHMANNDDDDDDSNPYCVLMFPVTVSYICTASHPSVCLCPSIYLLWLSFGFTSLTCSSIYSLSLTAICWLSALIDECCVMMIDMHVVMTATALHCMCLSVCVYTLPSHLYACFLFCLPSMPPLAFLYQSVSRYIYMCLFYLCLLFHSSVCLSLSLHAFFLVCLTIIVCQCSGVCLSTYMHLIACYIFTISHLSVSSSAFPFILSLLFFSPLLLLLCMPVSVFVMLISHTDSTACSVCV